jgi:pyruvate formate lyase activating enzyme
LLQLQILLKTMKEALFYTKKDDNKVLCELCPHLCLLSEGKTGNCRVRTNIGGKLISDNYGKISGYNLDPIEKKPLYHYFPGKSVLSIGSVGCNMHCKFCQNHEIAQTGVDLIALKNLSPDSIANDAMRRENNIGIAYTYNEPLVFYEFMRDTALLSRQLGLKNIMVTNGYLSPAPLEKTFNFIDAFNVDLKAFTDEFYRKVTSSDLNTIKDSLIEIKKSGIHFEITNLIIPGFNDNEDDFTRMMEWVQKNLGEETIFHLSRYFPRFKFAVPPTSMQTMEFFFEIASRYLKFVYMGNMESNNGQNTYCPECKHLLIERNYYNIDSKNLGVDGNCPKCNTKVIEYI